MKNHTIKWIGIVIGFLIFCNNLWTQDATVTVEAIGYGMTPKESEENALRGAVHKAIGLYISDETIVKNEDVIKDQILTASQGIVKSYDVIKSTEKNNDTGLYQISIRAIVRKDQVESKLKEAKIAMTNVEGKDLWAESISKIKNVEEGQKALGALFNDFDLPRSLLIARVVDDRGEKGEKAIPTTQPNEKNRKNMDIAFNVEIYYDLEAYYKQVAPKIIRLLDVIAKQKIEKVLIRSLKERENIVTAITGYPSREESEYCKFIIDIDQIRQQAGFDEKEILVVAVNIGRDRGGCNQRFAVYLMDKQYTKTWEQSFHALPELDVSLISKNHETIIQNQVEIKNTLNKCDGEKTTGLIPLKNVGYRFVDTLLPKSQSRNQIIILPEFGSDIYSDTILYRYETTLDSEDLKELGTIKVGFSNQSKSKKTTYDRG